MNHHNFRAAAQKLLATFAVTIATASMSLAIGAAPSQADTAPSPATSPHTGVTRSPGNTIGSLGAGHPEPGPTTPLTKGADGSIQPLPQIPDTPTAAGMAAVASPQAKLPYAAATGPGGAISVTLVTVQLADETSQATAGISDLAVQTGVNTASSYWNSMSNGRISMAVTNTVHGFKSSAVSTQNYDTVMNTVASEYTRASGWTQQPDTVLLVVIPAANLSYNGAGGILGATWSDGTGDGLMLLPAPSSFTNNVTSHEFGHVLGLLHANELQCTDGAADTEIGSNSSWADTNCYSREYGDTTDLMGYAQKNLPVINSYFWDKGNFGRGDEILNAGTAGAVRTFTLTAWGGTAANRAVKIIDPGSGETYYFELRLPVGYDTPVAVGGNQGVKIVKADLSMPWAVYSESIPPSTMPFSGNYNPNQAWQANSKFTSHTGMTVTINSIGSSSASITIAAVSPYVSYFKFSNLPTIYGTRADGSFQALTWGAFSAFGYPSYTTKPAAYFVKNSWSSAIYLVGADNKGPQLSGSDWVAYGSPAPTVATLIPGSYFYNKFDDSALYYASPAGEKIVINSDWIAAGSPTVQLPAPRYIKYSWDSTIYKQVATSPTTSTTAAINYTQWTAAGSPTPTTVSYVNGSKVTKTATGTTLTITTPAGAVHALTSDEWAAIPTQWRTYTISTDQFVKNSWSSAIYLVGADNKGPQLSGSDWEAYGSPAPTVSTLIPGSYFYNKFDDSALYYASPAGETAASNSDWTAAGSPALHLPPTRYIKYSWDTAVYRQDATSLTTSTATAVNSDQWAAAGSPTPVTVPYISGSIVFSYPNSASVTIQDPVGNFHLLTYDEWTAIPANNRNLVSAGNSRFVKNSWNPAIYLVGDASVGPELNAAQWNAFGSPAPAESVLIAGSYFFTQGSGTALFYASPKGTVPATQADWIAAGSPTVLSR